MYIHTHLVVDAVGEAVGDEPEDLSLLPVPRPHDLDQALLFPRRKPEQGHRHLQKMEGGGGPVRKVSTTVWTHPCWGVINHPTPQS